MIRGEAVISAFGPGTAEATSIDAAEREVLANGKEVIRVEHDARLGEYLRVIKPATAAKNYLGKDCTSCHQVPVGTTLGIVSMKISLDKVDAAAKAFLWQSVLISVLVSLPLFILLAATIRSFLHKRLGGEPSYAVEVMHLSLIHI